MGVAHWLTLFLSQYPVPGEVWSHLMSMKHNWLAYLKQYLEVKQRDKLVIVNTLHDWRHGNCGNTRPSPFRVIYGQQNPALAGHILDATFLIPNFAFTPSLIFPATKIKQLVESMTTDEDNGIMIYPAMIGHVRRLFCVHQIWYIASSTEFIPVDTGGALVRSFDRILCRHYGRGIEAYVSELDETRVWFFGLHQHAIRFLGTCARIYLIHVCPDTNLDFCTDHYLAPGVPLISTCTTVALDAYVSQTMHSVETLGYNPSAVYNGLVLLNKRTMFAVRLMYDEIRFLMPLLQKDMTLLEFTCLRVVESTTMNQCQWTHDQKTIAWYRDTVHALCDKLIGYSTMRRKMVANIRWYTQHPVEWIPGWFTAMIQATEIEMQGVHVDAQLLLRDIGDGTKWPHMIEHPRYTSGVAHAMAFCLSKHQCVYTVK